MQCADDDIRWLASWSARVPDWNGSLLPSRMRAGRYSPLAPRGSAAPARRAAAIMHSPVAAISGPRTAHGVAPVITLPVI